MRLPITSRYGFSAASVDESERLFLDQRVFFRYRALDDNRVHQVKSGDTLWRLAGRFFHPQPRPAGLWWVIADFQPIPIHDPTLLLVEGSLLVIPSLRTVMTRILSESRLDAL